MAMIETQRTPLYNQLTDATRQDAPRLTLYGEVASARVAGSGARRPCGLQGLHA